MLTGLTAPRSKQPRNPFDVIVSDRRRQNMAPSALRSFFTRSSHYQGQVDASNRKSGLGKQSQTNGLLYEGQWRCGLRFDSETIHGYGTLYRKLKETELYVKIYVGEWENGRKHGLGIKYYERGKYLGYWEHDQRHGHGVMWFDNGDFYMGEWLDDRTHGLGVFLKNDGNRYHGQFRRGLKHGEGVYLHSKTGQIQKGFWIEGIFRMGEIEDWNRNQVIEPTIYPVPEIKLSKFAQVYQSWMEEFSKSFSV